MKSIFKVCILFLVLVCVGCATVRGPQTFEVSGDYRSRHIKKIAVLPMMLSLSTQSLVNFESIGSLPSDVDTCRLIYPIVVNTVEHKNYTLLEPQTMAELFEKNGLHNIQQVYGLESKKLGGILNADAVLYFFIIDASSISEITFFVKLVDAKDGAVLWSSICNAPQRGGMAGGIAGGIGGAIGGGLSFFGPFAAAGGALVGSKIDKFIYSKLATMEGKIKETVINGFKSLPKMRI